MKYLKKYNEGLNVKTPLEIFGVYFAKIDKNDSNKILEILEEYYYILDDEQYKYRIYNNYQPLTEETSYIVLNILNKKSIYIGKCDCVSEFIDRISEDLDKIGYDTLTNIHVDRLTITIYKESQYILK